MHYIHTNKDTKKVRLFSSIKKLSNALKIPKDNLYTNFSRKKKMEVITDKYTIIKIECE